MVGGRPAAKMQLVDIAGPDDDDAPGPAPGARPDGPAPWRSPWVWWAVATVLVLLATAAAATALAARRADARAAELAEHPGFVRALDSAPVALWSATVPYRYGTVLGAGGALVTVSDESGTWTVVAADPTTGRARWSQEVVEASRAGFETVSVVCLPGRSGSGLVLCGWVEPGVVYGRRQTSEVVVPTTHLVAFDAATGGRAGQWQVRERLVGVGRVGDDLVVATATDDRRVLLERRGGADGAVRWSVTSPDELLASDGSRPDPRLQVGADLVVLTGTSTSVLDAASGDALVDVASGRQLLVVPLPGGGFATWVAAGGARLHDASGERYADVVGLPTVLAADDGSLDALLVDVGRRVVAVDPEDGATLWEQVLALQPVAVVDGLVLLGGDVGVGVVQGADGTVLWEHGTGQVVPFGPVTDGIVVIAPEPDGAGGWVLVARGLRDGVRVWSADLPDRPQALDVVDGRMVVRTVDGVVVLG